MRKLLFAVLVVGLAAGFSMGAAPIAGAAEPTLSETDFEEAKTLFFQRCAGCHGVLRKGATGKSLEPKDTLKLGQRKLERIITLGTEGGMNNFDDILTKGEIKKLATYIQMAPPPPPELDLATMKNRWKTFVKPDDYPTKPMHGRNWENFFLVKGRDYYETICGNCHGLDGKKIDDMVSIGKVASDNPWETLHKMRNGQPDEKMPALRALPIQIAIDILAHAVTMPR